MKFSVSHHISLCSAAFEVTQFCLAGKQNIQKKEQSLMFPQDVIKFEFRPEATKKMFFRCSLLHDVAQMELFWALTYVSIRKLSAL